MAAAVNGGFHVEGDRVRCDGCDVGFALDALPGKWSGGDKGFAAIGENFAAFLVVQRPASLDRATRARTGVVVCD
jgi:hypothetical protein